MILLNIAKCLLLRYLSFVYEVKSWTKCLSRRFLFSFRRFVVTSLLCFVVPFAILSCFVLSFRRFVVSLSCFVSSSLLQFRLVFAPFRRFLVWIRHFSPRFVVSFHRFVSPF